MGHVFAIRDFKGKIVGNVFARMIAIKTVFFFSYYLEFIEYV